MSWIDDIEWWKSGSEEDYREALAALQNMIGHKGIGSTMITERLLDILEKCHYATRAEYGD